MANTAFNGIWYPDRIGSVNGEGHSDLAVGTGCTPDSPAFYVIAPVSGSVTVYDKGIHLKLPPNSYLQGTLDALLFSGVVKPNIRYVTETRLDLGHVRNAKTGSIRKGEKVAGIDLSSQNADVWPPIIAYQVFLVYRGKQYAVSPSLFENDARFGCVDNSPFSCNPKPLNYAP